MVALGVGVGGCQVSLDVDSVVQPASSGCNPAVCGTNSPQIDHYGVFDFNIDPKTYNAQGFAVWGLIQDNITYDLVVENSQFVGKQHGIPVLTGSALTGAQIVLQNLSGTQYLITIERVGSVGEVVRPFNPVTTYMLQWDFVVARPFPGPVQGGNPAETPIGSGKPEAVCPNGPENAGLWEETSGMQRWDSVVFEGDRINPDALTIGHKPDDRWWNVGCNLHLLAKLRLTRNTIHTAGTWQNAQTAMKALAADYCGTGTSFTYSGEPLVWRNKHGMRFYDTPVDLEARWNETGAGCVGSPRLARTNNAQAAIDFPDLLQAIKDECASAVPPRPLVFCGDLNWNVDELSPELVTTGNYD
jgi:hypothetical protein